LDQPANYVTIPEVHAVTWLKWHTTTDIIAIAHTKVRTDSSTEFGLNPILIDRIRIESAAGSNPILIIQIRTALDRAVDFNKRITAFTTTGHVH